MYNYMYTNASGSCRYGEFAQYAATRVTPTLTQNGYARKACRHGLKPGSRMFAVFPRALRYTPPKMSPRKRRVGQNECG